MTTPAPKSPSPIIFAVILASASIVSLLIIVSPYILTLHDPGAISISASLNPTEVGQNQTVKVTVSDVNGLRIPNELALSGDWRVQNLSLGACVWPAQYPFGIAVFQGRYTIGNISSAGSPLAPAADFLPGAVYSCLGAYPGNSVKFGPLQNVSFTEGVSGYYTSGFTPVPGLGGGIFGIHHPFAPGEYTLVAGDEWGHVDILYFQVTSSSSTTTRSATSPSATDKISLPDGVSICSGDCGHPSPYLSATVLINSTGPISSLHLFINGTDEGSTPLNVFLPYNDSAMESFYYQYQAQPTNTSLSIQAGKTYSIELLAAFADGETSTVMALTTATTTLATTTSSNQVTTRTVSSTICPSNTTCASFTYSPTGQVRVDSVQATQQICQNCGAVNGQPYVYFHIVFENIGSSPVYVFGGFGYCEPLSTTVPTNSSVLQAVASERAACAGEIVTINPGQNYTVYAPYAGDGVSYQLVRAGTISVVFSFNWTTDPQATTFPNSTTISAQFVFA